MHRVIANWVIYEMKCWYCVNQQQVHENMRNLCVEKIILLCAKKKLYPDRLVR